MFRCLIVFLLINTFYCSFGYPLNETNVSIGKILQLLANNCNNTFVSTQIINKLEACNIPFPTEGEIPRPVLKCLIFYDINTQLCTVLQGSEHNVNKTYESRINQAQKVDVTCEDASKNWKFSNVPEYPKYYNTSQEVFKTTLSCLKVCGVEDLMSEDTNFFCKYYQWGSELLQAPLTPNTGNAVISGESGSGNITTTTKIPNSVSVPKPNNNPKETQQQPQVESPSISVMGDLNNSGNILPTNGQKLDLNHLNGHASGVIKENISILKTNNNKPLPANEMQVPKNAENSELKKLNVVENQESDDDSYDIGGDNTVSHDANNDDDPQLETENTDKQKKGAAILSSPNAGMSQRELYSNAVTNQFVEDDDHFFSFFLTAIILVIFLYVLYHNKSKFRKVVLGLLVEGRQSGRRRNSRGHEYRRLDTLEQAMSTNSTAPPSKIIY